MSVALVDGNVLVALAVQDHMHHQHARDWLSGYDGDLATCPITQGTLLRFLVREGLLASDAAAVLNQIETLPRHVFWPDEISYGASVLAGVVGHRQITDAYLAALATHFGGSLVTLDKGLAVLHPDVAVLIPA